MFRSWPIPCGAIYGCHCALSSTLKDKLSNSCQGTISERSWIQRLRLKKSWRVDCGLCEKGAEICQRIFTHVVQCGMHIGQCFVINVVRNILNCCRHAFCVDEEDKKITHKDVEVYI